jgi:hypothetical protein
MLTKYSILYVVQKMLTPNENENKKITFKTADLENTLEKQQRSISENK